jgi:hypothetical protein
VKDCAEEEDEAVAQSTSSSMLWVKVVWMVMPNCSEVALTSDLGSFVLKLLLPLVGLLQQLLWMLAAMLWGRFSFQMLLTLAK